MKFEKNEKAASIYFRFLKLVAVAFLASAFFFLIINRSGTALLQTYFDKTSYMKQENDRRIEAFEKYVTENELTAVDLSRLSEWTQQQEVVWMQIYREHILLFDSQYPYMEANAQFHVEGMYYDWDSYRTIEFADGDAQVFLTGMYTYQFFNYALLVEFFLSFLLFTGIIMAGIHSVMKYIRKLSGEIGILEGGNLDYPITVVGNDEMAVLAKGLDSMRQSIRSQMKQEAELIRLNQSMITSLSHDLRTPLTSLLLYTEILKENLDTDIEQARLRVRKIEEKTYQIRDMADRILEYSMQKIEENPETVKRQRVEEALAEPLADACACLKQQGFRVQTDLNWEEADIMVNPEYLLRIMDNISSNLLKYAGRNVPIQIHSVSAKSHSGLLFENAKKQAAGHVDSNHIGVPNICAMMEKMGGLCTVEETKKRYRIQVMFPRQ